MHGSLNHLLVGEHEAWFPRFAQGVSNRIELDAELEADRARLRDRLVEGAQRWAPLIAALPAERFDGTLDYTTTRGVAQSLPFSATLGHVFNHGTHHRGHHRDGPRLPTARHGVDAAGGGARVRGGRQRCARPVRQRQGFADLVAHGRDDTAGGAVLWSEK